MTTEGKVRMVRCPGCSGLLQEPDVPIYRCGGCGTVLQAKNRQGETKAKKPDSQETGPGQNDQTKDVPGFLESHMEATPREKGLPVQISDNVNEEAMVPSTVHSVRVEDDSNHEFETSGINVVDTTGESSTMTSQEPSGEIILSDDALSSSSLAPETLQKSSTHGSGGSKSIGRLVTDDPINPSSELSGTLQHSSTSGSCHKYDGSISSCDGTEDQIHDQHLQQSETSEVVDFSDTEKIRKGKKPPLYQNSKMEHFARDSFAIQPDKKNFGVEGSRYDRKEMAVSPRCDYPSRRDDVYSRLPFHSRSSQSAYEFGNSSKNKSDESGCSSSFQSSEKHDSSEQEQMKLLRMIEELRVELHRRDAYDGKHFGRAPSKDTWRDRHIPSFCSWKFLDREVSHTSNYRQCYGQCRRVKNFPQQHNVQRMAFSGEDPRSRPQVDDSCLHCDPYDRRWSVELLPPCSCCGKGQSMALAGGHGCHSSYDSIMSSPLHEKDSEFDRWIHSTNTNYMRHQDHRVLTSREQHQSVKHHLLPVAGAAPFITCYYCLKVLQLPADFLVFRRRCHRVRCSDCSEVLKFSLENRTHIVPYRPEIVAGPPPSEADGCSQPLASNANGISHEEPVSTSDDYGPSFSKSCSTDDKAASLLQENTHYTSDGVFQPVKQKKVNQAPRQPHNLHIDNEEAAYISGRPPVNASVVDKVSSEIEEEQTSSPLHRLMGYSSATQLLLGDKSETSSYVED